ncbi:sensor domain-containing diguanylate cyclase [Ancylobacter terrae]|uniref:sensor domain-containing diguanylate cyclase n=1 Tax=Ancylobacter sp. sgz301288 TaxID=3342077 RepID=UPI003858581D
MDTPPEERFDRLARLAKQFYRADVSFISFIDAEHQWMKAISSDAVPTSFPRRMSICNMMVGTGVPLVIGDLRSDARLDGHPAVAHLAWRFYAGVPLVAGNREVIGSLCVLREEAGATQDFDIQPLTELAAIAIDAIDLRQRNSELERLSQIDGLTGIANRRGFDDALDRAVRRARRTGEPLSLLLVDIDHFKGLNDTLGHPAGDAALRRMGVVLREIVHRPYDTVARYGGEEFAVILPDTDADGASHIGETLRMAVAAAALAHPAPVEVTVSLGCATLAGDAVGPVELVAQADAALYRAKRAGRNRLMGARGA